MNNKDNLLGVLSTIFRWKKAIIYICVATAIGTLIISFAFLDDYFESTTSFYTASPDLAKPPPIGLVDREINYYGEDEDIDRILAIAESSDIADFLINKYDLYTHYDIDRNTKKGPVKVKKRFAKLYKVTRTKYNSIEISIEDTDPELCTKMVKDARLKVNNDAQKLIKTSQESQKESLEKNILDKEKTLEVLNDSIELMRTRYGIIDVYTQGQIYAESLGEAEANMVKTKSRLAIFQQSGNVPQDTIVNLQANVKGFEGQINSLNERLKNFNLGLTKIRVLNDLHEGAREQLGYDKERHKQLESALEADFALDDPLFWSLLFL